VLAGKTLSRTRFNPANVWPLSNIQPVAHSGADEAWMKICLVTTFPPSRGGLSEYGFHIARELQRNPMLSLTVLADELPEPQPELEDFSVVRCWSFDRAGNPAKLLSTIRRLNPDVVWFNLLFTTFGHNPLIAFSGLTTPLLTRLTGYYTHVTLHHLMDGVDLQDAQIRFPRAYRAGGAIATKLLLLSNSVSVLLPLYRRILLDKYRGRNVHVRRHGVLAQRPEYPDFALRNGPGFRILAFGKWGTYKRLESLIAAFRLAAAEMPGARLVVAGTDHPRTPGYVDSVARKYQDDSRIEFVGYVQEKDVPDLFRRASVAVMPYSSSTGSSGVAHLACAYGVPIVCADIADFRQMQEEEGLGIEFYQPGSQNSLAACLLSLWRSPEKQRALGEQNFCVSLRMGIPRIVHDYVRHFDREQRSKALKPMTRGRRLPAWLPTSFLLRRSARWNWRTLAYDAARVRSALESTGGAVSADQDGGGDGHLEVSGGPVNGNVVGSRAGGGSGLSWIPPAGTESQNQARYGNQDEYLEYAAALESADPDQTHHAEGQQE
jgi:glycosyltransferase involved in cell wall biosynthesis